LLVVPEGFSRQFFAWIEQPLGGIGVRMVRAGFACRNSYSGVSDFGECWRSDER